MPDKLLYEGISENLIKKNGTRLLETLGLSEKDMGIAEVKDTWSLSKSI